MASYGDSNFTNFRGVNLRNTAAIRLELDGGFAGTVSVKPAADNNYEWTFPQKSGKFTVGGTFGVDLPIVASGGYLSTIVTVAGLRVEDALVVVPQNRDAVALMSARGALFVANAIPGNGSVTLLLANAFATATVASTQSVFAYSATR